MQSAETDKAIDFLIADLQQFGDSLWRNEERGEKRFDFFITLVAALIAGLVALHTQGKESLDEATLRQITNGALVGLLVFGLLTYLRMLHRNRVTDQYIRTLRHIREKILAVNPSIEDYKVPQPLNAGRWRWFRGGLAETVGAMNAVLLCALLIINSVPDVYIVISGLAALIVSWAFAARRKGGA